MAVMMKMMAIVHNDPFLCAWDFQFSTFFVVSVCLSFVKSFRCFLATVFGLKVVLLLLVALLVVCVA